HELLRNAEVAARHQAARDLLIVDAVEHLALRGSGEQLGLGHRLPHLADHLRDQQHLEFLRHLLGLLAAQALRVVVAEPAGADRRRIDAGEPAHMISSSASSAPAAWIASSTAIRSCGVTPSAFSAPTSCPSVTGRSSVKLAFLPSCATIWLSGTTTVSPAE